MLASLSVKDIVLIEKASLAFAPGLNVLTGETGAGKSILLDALGLATGSRGQGRAAVRVGAEQGAATAVFDLERDHPVRALLADSALNPTDDIILRRAVSADGRTRAFVNDEPVGVALAREVGAALVEVHGQADDRGLFDTATHRELLDRFGRHMGLAAEAASLFASYAKARDRVAEIERAKAAAAGEIDFLTHAVRELSDLSTEVGEEQLLAEERAFLMNAGRLAEELNAAADALTGEKGAETALAQTLRRFSRLNEEARRATHLAETAMESAFAQIQEARREIESLLSRLDAEPDRLDKVEERLFALRAAARKYATTCDGLAVLKDDFTAKLALLDEGGAGLISAQREAERLLAAFAAVARNLTAARQRAATKLETAVVREFTPLKLGQAKFRVTLAPLADDEVNANGAERVSFEIATVGGAAFGPLARIASGGELARFSLALKVALAEASPPAVLVFDEVDRGVGGAADAVGERLQKLALGTQVLLVTHSPQVAARAAKHFRISRARDATRVDELDENGRVEEIARMLAGAKVTDEARAAARRLITEAHDAPGKRRARA